MNDGFEIKAYINEQQLPANLGDVNNLLEKIGLRLVRRWSGTEPDGAYIVEYYSGDES